MISELSSPNRVPAEWPELLVQAEAAVPEFEALEVKPGWPKFTKLWRLHRQLDKHAPELVELGQTIDAMDMTRLDTNRYHALRYPIAGLFQALDDPETRQRVVDHGSELLLKQSSQGLKPKIDAILSNNKLGPAFQSEIETVYQSLEPSIRLAGDLLTGAALSRTRALELAQHGHTRPPRQRYNLLSRIYGLKLGESRMRQDLREGAAGGTSIIFRNALNFDKRFNETGIPSLAIRQALRHASMPGLARQACATRIAVVNETARFSYADGHLNFDARRPKPTGKPDDPLENHFTRHTTLVCPAAREGKSVETILDIVADMIDKTCVQLGEPELVDF